jgi:hypothetical protein
MIDPKKDGLHVHVWDKGAENPKEELDLEWSGEWDDHIQFGFEHKGEWIEIRVMK